MQALSRWKAIRAVAFAFLVLVPVAGGADTIVTVTQRAPIETLSTDGGIAGVKEASVGTKLTLVSMDGFKLTLADAQGTHYRIAQNATDYRPPVVAVTPTPTPAKITAQIPVPKTNTPPLAAAPAPTLTPAKDLGPVPTGDVVTMPIGNRETAKEMSVWPPGGIAGRPLLIAAHGNGGSGPNEIKGWLGIAKDHRFTIVCPSFLSSVNCSHLGEDDPYFRECLRWIADNLQYDKDNVYMTGFSGGGFATWYLATKRPDIFRGLFLQSGNFGGDYYNLSFSRWFNKPIKLIWGSADLPDISVENANALAMLKSAHCKQFTSQVVAGGHHQEHHDLVVSWMEEIMATPPPED